MSVREHPIADPAREAYAHGWARSGGPMTARVRAGCEAAVAYAVDHCDDPDVFEVTLHLGKLEGVWASVYDRRESLYARHIQTVTQTWRSIIVRMSVTDLVRQVRDACGAGDGHVTAARPEALTYASAAASRWLSGLYRDDHYPDLVSAATDALHAGAAEGRASALAVAAELRPAQESASEDHGDGFDFDLAFDHAYKALDDATWPADAWVQRIIQGNGTDLGHALADLIAADTSYEDMVKAIEDFTGSADVRAIETLLDQAMSQALNQGAVDLYREEGVASYDVLTAGDTRVCKACEEAEAASPYPVGTASPVPKHPVCRCAVAAHLPASAFASYLPEGG